MKNKYTFIQEILDQLSQHNLFYTACKARKTVLISKWSIIKATLCAFGKCTGKLHSINGKNYNGHSINFCSCLILSLEYVVIAINKYFFILK